MSTEERLQKLEDQMKNMNSNCSPDHKKVKAKREPSEYNVFVKNFINDKKTKDAAANVKFDHKAAFGAAASAWNDQKKSRSVE
jgi:hypothetical protein